MDKQIIKMITSLVKYNIYNKKNYMTQKKYINEKIREFKGNKEMQNQYKKDRSVLINIIKYLTEKNKYFRWYKKTLSPIKKTYKKKVIKPTTNNVENINMFGQVDLNNDSSIIVNNFLDDSTDNIKVVKPKIKKQKKESTNYPYNKKQAEELNEKLRNRLQFNLPQIQESQINIINNNDDSSIIVNNFINDSIDVSDDSDHEEIKQSRLSRCFLEFYSPNKEEIKQIDEPFIKQIDEPIIKQIDEPIINQIKIIDIDSSSHFVEIMDIQIKDIAFNQLSPVNIQIMVPSGHSVEPSAHLEFLNIETPIITTPPSEEEETEKNQIKEIKKNNDFNEEVKNFLIKNVIHNCNVKIINIIHEKKIFDHDYTFNNNELLYCLAYNMMDKNVNFTINDIFVCMKLIKDNKLFSNSAEEYFDECFNFNDGFNAMSNCCLNYILMNKKLSCNNYYDNIKILISRYIRYIFYANNGDIDYNEKPKNYISKINKKLIPFYNEKIKKNLNFYELSEYDKESVAIDYDREFNYAFKIDSNFI